MKSVRDSISRLKSKINKKYLNIFNGLENHKTIIESINNQPMLTLADKMGLLDIDQYLLQTIVSGIEFSDVNPPTSSEK